MRIAVQKIYLGLHLQRVSNEIYEEHKILKNVFLKQTWVCCNGIMNC